jgi:hypothetical protein
VLTQLRRVLDCKVSVVALLELGMWFAIPYIAIGVVVAGLHMGQLTQLKYQRADYDEIVGFGLVTALWPAVLVADRCAD